MTPWIWRFSGEIARNCISNILTSCTTLREKVPVGEADGNTDLGINGFQLLECAKNL